MTKVFFLFIYLFDFYFLQLKINRYLIILHFIYDWKIQNIQVKISCFAVFNIKLHYTMLYYMRENTLACSHTYFVIRHPSYNKNYKLTQKEINRNGKKTHVFAFMENLYSLITQVIFLFILPSSVAYIYKSIDSEQILILFYD